MRLSFCEVHEGLYYVFDQFIFPTVHFVTENLGLHPDPDLAKPGSGSGFREFGSEKVLDTNGFINHT
jgi:hypothetical protein